MCKQTLEENLAKNAALDYPNWVHSFMRIDFNGKHLSYSGYCLLENNYPEFLNLGDSNACDEILNIVKELKKTLEEDGPRIVTEMLVMASRDGNSEIRYSTEELPTWKIECLDEIQLERFVENGISV